MRHILSSGIGDPFEEAGVGIYMSLALENTPVIELIRKQEIWDIDWNCNRLPEMKSHFLENDRQMVLDPDGEKLLAVIGQDMGYAAIVPEQGVDCGLCCLHSLLTLAKASNREDVSRCCETRIAIFLWHSHDARWESRCTGHPCDQYPKSPTRLALSLGISNIWESALRHAEWSEYEIQELFDEETYLGVPELLCGCLMYRTQDECRKDFVDKLCRGYFAWYSRAELCRMAKEIAWNIGVSIWGEVLETMLEANSVYLQKSMPGAWPTETEVRLVPEIDFDLPEYDMFHREINWQDYAEMEEEGEILLTDELLAATGVTVVQ